MQQGDSSFTTHARDSMQEARMDRLDTIELLGFNLKLLSSRHKKNVLLSAGKLADKERMLPAVQKLLRLEVSLFATPGTSRFLTERGIPNQEVYKIADRREPNIQSLLRENRFDLVINVLTGNIDYDEASDCKLIRALSIESGIPLITDVDVSILTIEQLVRRHEQGLDRYRVGEESEPWNLRTEFFRLVAERGGMACYHAHFDKAYLISTQNLKLSQVDMKKKWDLYKYLKENYTHEDLVERISRGVEKMIEQGITHCRTLVDADSTVKLLPVEAALEVKERYRNRIVFEFGVQPLQGVLDPESRKYFTRACELADCVGGLPSKDRPLPEKHLDYIFAIAREQNKRIDVHVDQENNPYESETEMLALKAIEHGMEGRVSAIHSVSLAAKPPHEQERIIKLLKDAGVSVIVCPSAALSMKQLDLNGPLHNSIAPVPRLIEGGVQVYLGVDNIHDLFMPLVDGDMWFECRMLMEACRYYDIQRVAEIACDRSGFKNPNLPGRRSPATEPALA
jgi:cytosine/creatinine deaminase